MQVCWQKHCNFCNLHTEISAKNSYHYLQCVYTLPILEHCDLEEINVIGTVVPDVSGKYLKQTYTENGKPWYKHEDVNKVSWNFYYFQHH